MIGSAKKTAGSFRPRHIFLAGFSGSGKSTIGPRLARRLKTDFYDADALIERRAGKSISRIFEDNGEPKFRKLESETIAKLAGSLHNRAVIALGGGALRNRTTERIVREHGLLVYLSCPVRELARRLMNAGNRPLLRAEGGRRKAATSTLLDRIARLLKQRRPGYERADIRVSTAHKTVNESVHELVLKLRAIDAGR
ncbi:MAG TPA: shikimate kinase [Candidatus Deferrimicrobium sp.]|nr:shikimate kinase [Candidatus Deferrimicrobium sp.]